VEGLLLVDKPKGITSFDIVRRLRQTTGVRKIGHAGTLDPLASGLMLLLLGSATKQASRFVKLEKEYLAEITLGAVSSTGDAEGILTPSSDAVPGEKEVREAVADFIGGFTVSPPVYSAIKIDGQEAYKRARRGETVTMPARQMTIFEAEFLAYDYPVLKLRWKVSSGSYVRTLAQHLGARLNTGAYLSGLVRTKVGKFDLAQAMKLDADRETLRSKLIKLGEQV
jgi:tRNA pseudouridine55 synthase